MMKTYTRTRPILVSLAIAIICVALFGGSLVQSASAQRGRPRHSVNAPRASVDRATLARAEAYTKDRFNYFTETPRGARIVAVNRPRPEALRAIDAGLAELFAVARRHNYRARVNYADYVVFIARADRMRDSTGAYSPDMSIGAANYAGSIYDQGGYVYAAGIVSSFNPAAFIVAEHERDFERMSNVVRYEGEHLVLYHNDRRRFQETADHSRGGSHPILK